MEAWRKQCLLAYCGYYPYKDIDDDWGDQSRQATEAFQSAYEIKVDGVFGNGTLARIVVVVCIGTETFGCVRTVTIQVKR